MSQVFVVVDDSPRLGKHVFCSKKGLVKTIENATSCRCVQISLSSMQSWHPPHVISNLEADMINNHCETFQKSIYSHLPYLCNFGNPDLQSKAMKRLYEELVEMTKINGRIVLHPSAKGTVEEVANCLSELQGEVDDNIILLENAAGQGKQSVMSSLEDIDYLARRLPFVGFCIDTCHSFAASMCKFDTEKSVHQLMADLDHIIGRDRLKCFHLNDSETPYGSRVDRHEDIVFGKGYIWGQNHQSLITLMTYASERGIDMIREGKDSTIDGQGANIDLIALRRIMKEHLTE